MDCTVIIPAYQPPDTLPAFMAELRRCGFQRLILVDDGSGIAYTPIFDRCKEKYTTILRHKKNKGKGEALKTALHYYMSLQETTGFLITADCDGQHLTKDILSVFQKLREEEGPVLILGARKFDHAMPFLSRIGNIVSSRMMKTFFHLELSDTQTGLRGFSAKMIPFLLHVPGKRYEYETNMLICAAREGILIRTAEIRSVYINKNRESHYRPFRDSLRVTLAITAHHNKNH